MRIRLCKRWATFILALLIAGLCPSLQMISSGMDAYSAHAGIDPIDEAMSQMRVEDLIGQLFVVTFLGNDTSSESEIAQLVRDYRVGGVVLLPENKNFDNTQNVPAQITKLTNDLQGLAFGQDVNFVPLFIAAEYAGDGFPNDDIRTGLTALPSEMALGATWQTGEASVVGNIAGRELSLLGINMMLGPFLDVSNLPRPGLKGDLATATFGGDPFWVGQFGRAYIKGVHEGSNGKVITVAKHFPGLGTADRKPNEEIPTVPKSLSELKTIELAPFMAVTTIDDRIATTDALMSSHIRYRGFQGNIRQLTRPISVDPQNLRTLLAEPEFAQWRKQGGLLMTDALGVPSIRRYYDPQLQSFPFKRIAQDAFLAGNDLLFLFQYGLTDNTWEEQFENIKGTIEFFREKYATDSDFKAQVDESVRRILQTKYRMYGKFDLDTVRGDSVADGLASSENSLEISRIAKEAITLIYPTVEDLPERLLNPPSVDDNILIFTDAREVRDCADCTPQPLIAIDSIEKTMVRLYGPNGSAQIDPGKITSMSFAQVKGGLLAPASSQAGSAADINAMIERADWIIFAMLNVNTDEAPAADSVKTFLRLRSDSLRDKKIIVMAYGAPYYLDTTEISKLTAYYGVYSKIEPFIEASIRALFQEYIPGGVLPVSVEGINYDLITQTAPDSRQIIDLEVENTPDARPGQNIDITVGTTVNLRTGMILDKNGHIVPDGTPVRFRLIYPAERLELPRRETFTVGGIAETRITLEHAGQLEVTASSDPANQSVTLVLTVHAIDTQGTAQPTTDGSPGATTTTVTEPLTSTADFAWLPADSTVAAGAPYPSGSTPRVTLSDLWLTMAGMIVLTIAGDLLRLRGGRTRTYRLRLVLMGLAFGLAGYTIYALGILGTWKLWYIYRQWGAILFGLIFSVVPLLSVLLIRGIHVSRRTS